MIIDLNTGTGITKRSSVTYNNGVAQINKTGNYMDIYFNVVPLTEINIKCDARATSNINYLIGIDLINADNSFTALDSVDLKNKDWMPIDLTFILPVTTTQKQVRAVFGTRSGVDGLVEFKNIEITTKTKKSNKPELLACGFIRHLLNSNTVDLHPLFPSYGIKSMTYDNTQITVTLDADLHTDRRPLILVSGTGDSVLIPVAGSVDATNNTIIIKHSNGTEFKNTLAETFYVNVFIYI